MGSEHLGHGLLLGFAQLWEFFGDMRHRAVVLADLYAVDGSAHPGGGRDVTGVGQRAGDALGGRFDIGVLGAVGRLDAAQDRVDAPAGERLNRFLTADFAQLPHGRGSQVVVGVVELGAAGSGQPEPLRGPAPAGLLPGRGCQGFRVARLDQRVEVTPYTRGRQMELVADLSGGDRSRLQQQADDGLTGVTVGNTGAKNGRRSCRDFHNTSVTQFPRSVYQGCPERGLRWSHRRPSVTCRYAALMVVTATRHHTLSSSIASLHGDEQAVGSPLNAAERSALQRTRLFGATGTVLMGIGALGAGARPVVQDPTFGVRLLNLPSRIQTVSLTMTTTGAVMMALAWLMLGRFAMGKRRMSRGDLDRTLLLWTLPLLIAPPMYSKDVYSYLAQSQISLQGLDPYKVGPASGLGLGHVFTLSVPSLWRETPAPYGPLFLWIGRGISALTGQNIVAAVLCHRLVVLIGVGLIVWAVPRLARRCGVAEVSALWLGAANPLLIMHLVAGIHNEALMLGLMLSGAEFALRGIDSPQLWPSTWRSWRRIGPDWEPFGMLLAGSILIILSSQVKLPSLLALGFVGMALAYRSGGTVRALFLVGAGMTALSLAVMALVGWASGCGFGWIYTLGTANVVRSWMSPPTLLALGTGQVGILLGLGDHTTAVLSLTRGMGVLIIMVMVVWLLLAVFRGRLHPIGGLGVALGICVLLFPVVQPWYLLWAVIPLACWATRTGFRETAIIVTLVVGIFGPTANGDRFALFQIVDATVASTIIVVMLIAVTYNHLPWRRLPSEAHVTTAEPVPPPRAATPMPPLMPPLMPPKATPDAYADST